MDVYGGFARVYDLFQDNVDYEAWCENICALLREQGISDGLVLDLGCGTGNMTELLARAGYDMIGVDSAEEMLAEAMDKKYESGLDILYLQQDMREFELYGTVRAVVSVCDCLNYLLSEEELLKVFALVHNYLDPGGIFLFDMNTIYKFETMLGDRTIAENRDEGSLIWENEHDSGTGLHTSCLTFFLPVEEGLYERVEEIHRQRAYEVDVIKKLVEQAGLTVVNVFDAYQNAGLRRDSGRMQFLCRKV